MYSIASTTLGRSSACLRRRLPGPMNTGSSGSHPLRHFYASTALHEGESVKALSEYLGHADPGITLRTYTHLVRTVPSAPSELSMRCSGTRRRCPIQTTQNQTKASWTTFSQTRTTVMTEHAGFGLHDHRPSRERGELGSHRPSPACDSITCGPGAAHEP